MFIFLFFNHCIVTNSKNTETPVINTDASVQKKQNKHLYILTMKKHGEYSWSTREESNLRDVDMAYHPTPSYDFLGHKNYVVGWTIPLPYL